MNNLDTVLVMMPINLGIGTQNKITHHFLFLFTYHHLLLIGNKTLSVYFSQKLKEMAGNWCAD